MGLGGRKRKKTTVPSIHTLVIQEPINGRGSTRHMPSSHTLRSTSVPVQMEQAATSPTPVANVQIEQVANPPTPVALKPEFEADTTRSSMASTARSKKMRGPTRGVGTEKIVLSTGKIPIVFHRRFYKPVCENARMFVNELGYIVRNFAPLKDVHSWSDISWADKEPMYELIKSKFNIVDLDLPHIKNWCEVLWARRYTEHRYKLSNHYKNCIKDRLDLHQHPYKDFDKDAWLGVCDFFATEEFKRRPVANTENCNKKSHGHISGSKSFAEIYVEKKKSAEETPSMIEMHKDTKCRSNGEWVSSIAESHYSRQEGQTPMSDEEICGVVLGTRPGYIKGLGPGPRPSGSRDVPPAFVDVVKNLQEENKTLRTEMQELKALVLQMASRGCTTVESGSVAGAEPTTEPTDGAENTG